MNQLVQNLRSGNTVLEEIPRPQVKRGAVLIRTTRSLVSLGTERMLVEFGKASLIEKARQQPDKVKMVLEKVRTEGLMPTLEAVFSKLDQPLPLGYCNVGVVTEVGAGVVEFRVGDRVVSNGPHAEVVCVPQNLVAKIPDNVSDEAATFTVVGAIGLQGIRLAEPTLGETLVVFGLGLIGLLTAQLLRANGCRVIGIDLDPDKCQLATSWGLHTINPSQGQDPVLSVLEFTRGVGSDAVIITASAKTNDIVSQAARMSRKRGRIILVGVVGLELSRAEFYEKELRFQVSCSYGPGRYDDDYEQNGIDYPLAFVRWTEKRNFEAVLHALSSGAIRVEEMISDRVPFEQYQRIYDNISESKSIASILEYGASEQIHSNAAVLTAETGYRIAAKRESKVANQLVGIIGAGNFTNATLLPALKGSGAEVKYIASSGGVSSSVLAQKFGIPNSTTDYRDLLNDPEISTVLITTRHGSHAHFATEALRSGKHVFVEKPLALTHDQLSQILEAYNERPEATLMVGYNRRFSPHSRAIRQALGDQPGPLNIVATMNAGALPPNLWVHDLETGGGRILGEACHFIDLCSYLTGSNVTSVCMNAMGPNAPLNTDNASILLRYANGSNAVINYFANGSKAYSKERIEVYSLERTFVLDNFMVTRGYGAKGFKTVRTRLDKGHKAQFQAYMASLKAGENAPIRIDELVNTTLASFAALESYQKQCWVDVSAII